MSKILHATRIGLHRGWLEFVLGLRSPQDLSFYLFMGFGALAALWFNRGEEIEGTTLTFAQVALPSVLAAILVFTIVLGPAYALAVEREDGTLLRSRIAPYGLHGYLVGVGTLTVISLLPVLVIVLGGATVLLEGAVPTEVGRWVLLVVASLLGILASLPLGFAIGALVPSFRQVTTWGMVPIGVLAGISGVFAPIDGLWEWVQWLAQAFPLYWLGHLMRYAFLPEAAAAVELGGVWRIGTGVAVLIAWTTVGAGLAAVLVRRMARRQSGSSVARGRDDAANWVVR